MDFRKGLEDLINRHSKENGSDTPDFILADYLGNCLDNFDAIVSARERWYGRGPKTGGGALVETDPSVPDHPSPR